MLEAARNGGRTHQARLLVSAVDGELMTKVAWFGIGLGKIFERCAAGTYGGTQRGTNGFDDVLNGVEGQRITRRARMDATFK